MALSNDVINTILAEAGGSGVAGMNAVAHVIANRAAQRGLSPEQVVAQPHQFEGFFNPSPGGLANESNPTLRAQAQQIWNSIGQSPDPTSGAVNYYGDYISPPAWAKSAPYGTVDIGGNVFIPQAPTGQTSALAYGPSSMPTVPQPLQAIQTASPTAPQSPFDNSPLGHVVQAIQGQKPTGGLLGLLLGGNNGAANGSGGLGGLFSGLGKSLGGLFGGGGAPATPANFSDAGSMGFVPLTDIHGNARVNSGPISGTNSNGSLV